MSLASTKSDPPSRPGTPDPLGRLVSRTEPEGISTFTWGASAASRNIGRLVSKTAPGYGESYAYDAVGRPASRTIVSDQTYQYDYTYNSIGELDTLTYPASPVPTGQSQARLKLQYRYVVGELAQIDDLTTGRTLWRLDATNDDHSPTRETVAGICHARGANAKLPAQWLVYVQVKDVAKSARKAEALGGAIVDGPRDMGGATFCVIRDPAGAVCALISPPPAKRRRERAEPTAADRERRPRSARRTARPPSRRRRGAGRRGATRPGRRS